MNVNFEIKLQESDNKNFLVFVATELTTKLNYELMQTSNLVWNFKRNHATLNISHGLEREEEYQVEEQDTYYSSRTKIVTKTRTVLDKDVIKVSIHDTESMSAVNDVFNTINKYAKLIVDEHQAECQENELNEILDEVACCTE